MLVEWINRHQPFWLERLRLGAPFRVGPTGEIGLFLADGHRWHPETVFVQLIAKIDETNTHGAGFMMMAGYAARLNQWNRFDRQWSKSLRKSNLEYFHAKEHYRHPFAAKGMKFADTNLMFGFVVRMDDADFEGVYRKGTWGGKTQPDSQYGLCFRYCLSFVFEQAMREMPSDDLVINFVVEDGHPNCGAPATIVDGLKKKKIAGVSEYFGHAVVGQKKKVPGLQVADGLAYWALQVEAARPFGPSFVFPKDAPDYNSTAKCPLFRCHADREELAKFRDDYFSHVEYRRNYWKNRRGPS